MRPREVCGKVVGSREVDAVALVMGALFPRTRDAQVALYASSAVQHSVARDAIGLGLNMVVP